jgi:hypothetical protein
MIETVNHRPGTDTIFICEKKNFADCKKKLYFRELFRIMNQNLN